MPRTYPKRIRNGQELRTLSKKVIVYVLNEVHGITLAFQRSPIPHREVVQPISPPANVCQITTFMITRHHAVSSYYNYYKQCMN